MNVANTRQTPKNKPGKSKAARNQELNTMSDSEEETRSDVEANLVEPDEDESDDSERDGDQARQDGLEQRYQKAFADEAISKGGSTSEDHSFTRYLRASQIG